MSNRVNAKLYRFESTLIREQDDIPRFIQHMVTEYYSKSGNEFKRIPLNDGISEGNIRARLYCYTSEPRNPEWKDFLNEIVKDENSLDELQNQYTSFILFIFTDDFMYAITRGYYGHHLIAEYIESLFGLNVLSKLVDKSSSTIKQLEQRAVFGMELGAERFFRESFNLSYEDDFGKIYKKMLTAIDEEDFDKLGIVKKRDNTTSVSVEGSASLDLSSRFEYTELLKRVEKIEELLQTEGITFNQFYEIPYKQLNQIKPFLKEELVFTSFNAFHNDNHFDFYHPNVFAYLGTSDVLFENHQRSFQLRNRPSNFDFLSIMELLIGQDLVDVSDRDKFKESMINCKGSYFDNKTEQFINPRSLVDWLNAEINLGDENYFKIDEKWYKYQQGFDEYLKGKLEVQNWNDLILKGTLLKMKSESEGEYNFRHKSEKNLMIVGDTVSIKYLELFDLMRIEENDIYIYHVKLGLSRDMRVVINQLQNANRLLISESTDDLLSTVYERISRNIYKSEEITYMEDGTEKVLSEVEFIQQIKDKTIHIVLAYSSSSDLPIMEEIIKSGSRVAKLSLLYCIWKMASSKHRLHIERIPVIGNH